MKYRALLWMLIFSCGAHAEIIFKNWEDTDAEPWKESTFNLPPFPEDRDLIEFSVGATESAKYFIDQRSIDAGHDDNVVRYTMVVKTAGGATNVSYEGLRCDQRQLRIYATGRLDKTWKAAPYSEWKSLGANNRHQTVLAREYFCPVNNAIWTPEQGREALRRGGLPVQIQ